MKEILVARNAFALTLTSSAVAKSVTRRGIPPGQRDRVDLIEELSGTLAIAAPAHPEHESIRGQGCPAPRTPSRRNSGFQATWADGWAAATSASRRAAVPTGTVDLPTTSDPLLQMGDQGGDGRIHVAQIGGTGSVHLRGADGQEVHPGGCGVGEVARETQPTARERVAEEGLEARLEEMRVPGPQGRHLGLIQVDPDHIVPEGRHGGGMNSAEVAAADHRNAHL